MVLTWFGCGLAPRAPARSDRSAHFLLPGCCTGGLARGRWRSCAIGLFFVGWIIAAAHFRDEDAGEDPQWVVVDEVAGQWLALAAVPLHPAGYLLAFALFSPVRHPETLARELADRKIGGAWVNAGRSSGRPVCRYRRVCRPMGLSRALAAGLMITTS